MKRMILWGFLLLLLSTCGPKKLEPGCEPEILANDNPWNVTSCSTPYWPHNTTWHFDLGKSVGKRFYKESLSFQGLPIEVGTYSLKNGISEDGRGQFLNEAIPTVIRADIDEDIVVNIHQLDSAAESYLKVLSYDPETGLLTGAFYTEWIDHDEVYPRPPHGPGPEHLVMECEYFEVVIDQSETP